MDAMEIINYFKMLSIDITSDQALKLSTTTSSLEGAMDYYFQNPQLFGNEINKTGSPKESLANEVTNTSKTDSIIQNSTQQTTARTNIEILSEMGFSSENISFALSRTSSAEGAINILNAKYGKAIVEKTFTCPVCMTNYPAEDMITLSCEPIAHRFCKECFTGYCDSKISQDEVLSNQLSCPALCEGNKPCGTPITIFEIKANISEELYIKYERFSTRAYCESQNFQRCPNCNEWYVDIQSILDLEREWKAITCEKCQHRFCGKCGQRPHKGQKDQNITCEEFAKWLSEQESTDNTFRNYLKEHKIFSCPKCKMPGELLSGCKFLYCRCKSTFCALCGVQLKEKQHFSHFKGGPGCTGPFGDGCLGVTDTAGVD